MVSRVERNQYKVDEQFAHWVEQECLVGTGVEASTFWQGLTDILTEFTPRNAALLAQRDELQRQLDDWHRANPGKISKPSEYEQFLRGIGYLVDEPNDCVICTENVDLEIAGIAGPQLVVPVMNARYALNAANARWGSLYDALYGTDAISESGGREKGDAYNVTRGAAVVDWGQRWLDATFPLITGRHADVTEYRVTEGTLVITLRTGQETSLKDPAQFVGYRGQDVTELVLLKNHGLHVELQFDRAHPIGKSHPAGLKDVVLESAVTTIQDCEDSVAAVDAEDKTAVYANWLGLMKADLVHTFQKSGATVTRQLADDREYRDPDGNQLELPGRSLMLVRNVGLLMTTDAVVTPSAGEVPEGILDAVITAACAMHDLKKTSGRRNSRAGSVYIVKPKMHGPEEVAFTVDLFGAVEALLGLERNTLKIGIMDEERRTTVNLRACIRAARSRVVFINTGFLDRTGDEIHTAMHAGAMLPKDAIKDEPWIAAYERANVAHGLASGFRKHAQIGKGMWPKPDRMQEMLATKIEHPMVGANSAWVPSPTAATLHATHYHRVDVFAQQAALSSAPQSSLTAILTPPLLLGQELTADSIEAELENNAQSILGYVVRWIDHGVGCSSVPDRSGVNLMEDRATLRISSQLLANWLHHGVATKQQVFDAFARMAVLVDEQNAADPAYRAMSENLRESLAFRAACDLVFSGREQPNGYTEPLLHKFRREFKAGSRSAHAAAKAS